MKLKIAVLVTSLLAIFVNFLAIALPLNNKTTQQLSDAIPTYFTPAGYVFSIWGIIYIGMLSFSIYQLVRKVEMPNKTNIAFIVGNIANAIWIFAWHYQQVYLSVLIMIVLLMSLIYTYINLSKFTTRSQKLALKLPVRIYLGWISVATIANIAAALYLAQWNGFGISGVTWSIIMIIVATVLNGLMLIKEHDVAYALVIAWSLFGIYSKFIGISNLNSASLIMTLIVLGMTLFVVVNTQYLHRK